MDRVGTWETLTPPLLRYRSGTGCFVAHRRQTAAHSGKRQTTDDHRLVGRSVGDYRCGPIPAVPAHIQLRAVVGPQARAAYPARVRGGAPLCPRVRADRFRRDCSRNHADRPRGSEIWRLARIDLADPGGTVAAS